MSEPKIRLDLNNPVFQEKLFHLQKNHQTAILSSLKKLAQMTWAQLYQDAGFNWELLHSKVGPRGEKLYSLRIGKGFRALAYREGEYLRLISLPPDHDSAYR